MSLLEWGGTLPPFLSWSAKDHIHGARNFQVGSNACTHQGAWTLKLNSKSRRKQTLNVIRDHPPRNRNPKNTGFSSMRVPLVQAKGSRSWRDTGLTCSNPPHPLRGQEGLTGLGDITSFERMNSVFHAGLLYCQKCVTFTAYPPLRTPFPLAYREILLVPALQGCCKMKNSLK